MCMSCVVTALEIVDDHFVYPDITPQLDLAITLIQTTYQLPGGGTGGPMHVELDDFNLDDAFFHESAKEKRQSEYKEFFVRTSTDDFWIEHGAVPETNVDRWIIEMTSLYMATWATLAALSECERVVACGIAHGMLDRYPSGHTEQITATPNR